MKSVCGKSYAASEPQRPSAAGNKASAPLKNSSVLVLKGTGLPHINNQRNSPGTTPDGKTISKRDAVLTDSGNALIARDSPAEAGR